LSQVLGRLIVKETSIGNIALASRFVLALTTNRGRERRVNEACAPYVDCNLREKPGQILGNIFWGGRRRLAGCLDWLNSRSDAKEQLADMWNPVGVQMVLLELSGGGVGDHGCAAVPLLAPGYVE
jgi:hypothetical protein